MANAIRIALIVAITLALLKVAGSVIAILALGVITARYVVAPLVLRTENAVRGAINSRRSAGR